MLTITTEVISLLEQASEYEAKYVLDFLKHKKIDTQQKKEALYQLVMMRKKNSIISNDYKKEYNEYLDERYKI